MMKVDSQSFEDWLAKADNDLKAAEAILAYYEDPPTDTICYHCHQVAEKTLKAFLVKAVGEIPKTHDLIELLNLCGQIKTQISDLREEVETLNKYYIEAKYPPDQPIICPTEEAKTAIEQAVYLSKFIKDLIKD